MKLNKVKSQSRTTDVDSVAKQIIGLYEASTVTTDAHLAPMMEELRAHSESIAGAINKATTENDLEERDDRRDDAIRNFYYLVRGFLHHPSPEVSEAAQIVLNIFDGFGLDIVREGYSVESSLIDSLGAQLSEEAVLPSIALLPGVSQLVETIVFTQKEFADAYLAFNAQKTKAETIVSASTVKKSILAVINGKIVVYLRAMSIVAEHQFGDFCRMLATIIDTNNGTVERR